MTLRAAKLPEYDLYTHEKLNKILSQQKAQKEESKKSHEVLVREMCSMKSMMASVLANQAVLMNHLLNSTNPGNFAPPVPPLLQHQNECYQSLQFNRPHIDVAAPEVEVVTQGNDIEFGDVPAEVARGDMQTVSPTTSPEQQRHQGKGKKRDGSSGDGRHIPTAKRAKSNGANEMFKELGRGQSMQSAPSGLEGYAKMKLYDFITVVATKRLQGVVNPADSNPLRLGSKENTKVISKLWRMLNFLTDNCDTEEEYKIWAGRYNVLPANADRAAREGLDARIALVAKALSKRAEEWLDSVGCKKNLDICGTLRSRIETFKSGLNKEKIECKWDRRKALQIRSRKRMSATEAAAAAAVEEEAEEE